METLIKADLIMIIEGLELRAKGLGLGCVGINDYIT